jgi:hypothetical protein
MVALPGATALKKTDEFITGQRFACVRRLVLRTSLDPPSTDGGSFELSEVFAESILPASTFHGAVA